MRQTLKLFLLFFISLYGTNTFAQKIIAEKGSYGIDKTNKIIVWHQSNLDSINSNNETITSIKFDAVVSIEDFSKKLSYSEGLKVANDYVLYITKLPLIHITIDTSSIDSQTKIAGFFTYFNEGEFIKSTMGVRYRGNLSLGFPKKSYDLEFWTDSISKQKKDVKFKGMRSDDDWILDGMYNEPLRLRSHIATNLWTKIHKPYYATLEPKAKSGFEVKYVEVFKNRQYYGLYQLSESVDRKQLKLKKNLDNSIFGELYKANSYKGGPDFTKAPEYNNLFPHWNGWRTEYPFINFKSEWKNLAKLQDLVVNSTDETFSNTIAKHVNIDNVIDYYLFINMVRATDNLGKNYYLGKYDKTEPYFFIPWDLDGVMGIIQDGKRETYTKDILSNGLFKRLLKTNPDQYKDKVKSRWIALRADKFSSELLLSKVDKIYNRFTIEKIYEREKLVWINKLDEVSNTAHYAYLNTWLGSRLEVLDAYFKAL